MKKIIVITGLMLCMLPAAGIAEQIQTPPAAELVKLSPKTSATSDLESTLAAKMMKDEDLMQISGQSNNGSHPWIGSIPGKMDVISKIKLWDEADRAKARPDMFSVGTIKVSP